MDVDFSVRRSAQIRMPDGSVKTESWDDLSDIFEVEYNSDGFIAVNSWQIYSEMCDAWVMVDLENAKNDKHLGWELIENRVIDRWLLLRDQELNYVIDEKGEEAI